MSQRTMVLILAVSVLLCSVFLSSDADGEETPPDLERTALYLTEGMGLGPMEPDPSDPHQAVSIPNGFVQKGLGPLKIIPIGETVWRPVGTWYGSPLKGPIILGGTVDMIVHVEKPESDGGSPTSEFLFEILRDSDVLLEVHVDRTTLTEGQDIQIRASGSFPRENDTTVPAGTSIAFRVSAKSNGGGAVLKFGSGTYASGLTFDSDALKIRDVRMDRDRIVVEYRDAFMVPYNLLYHQLMVDNVIVPPEEVLSRSNPVNMTREIEWKRESSYGEYEVFVTMGYSSGLNISRQRSFRIEPPKEKWLGLTVLVSNNLGMIVVVLLGLSAFLLHARHRSSVWTKRGEKLGMEGSGKKAVKRAWKEREKNRREEMALGRRQRVVEEEDADEVEDREFELFSEETLDELLSA